MWSPSKKIVTEVSKRLREILPFLSLTLFLNSCANQIPPTGGPKDEDPPKLISSAPDDKALNFKSTTIALTFDESIDAPAVKSELIITPTYSGNFESRIRKNTLILDFDTAFNDSTTYTLNFRNAVKDLTEGNVSENLLLAFSTWQFLDSLSISGKIQDLLTQTPQDNFLVAIYDPRDTTDAFSAIPLYFTKTNEDGLFAISNVKSSTYNVASYYDKNDNLLANTRSEPFGFLAQSIQLDSSIQDILIEVLDLDLSELRLNSARQNGQYYELKTSKYVLDYQLTNIDSQDTLHSTIGADHRSILIYNTLPIQDSLRVQVALTDSIYNHSVDTIAIRFEDSPRAKNDFTFSLADSEILRERGTFAALLKFDKPIASINPDSVVLKWDSLTFTHFEPGQFLLQSRRTEVQLSGTIPDSTLQLFDATRESPVLFIRKGAFFSIEGDTSLLLTESTKVKEARDYGIIRGTVQVPDSTYFTVQLLNPQFKVLHESKNTTDFSFTYVPPGSYFVRVLIDQNRDGFWHPGNPLVRLTPEPVLFYTSPEGDRSLSIRANWELVDIDIQLLKSL